MTDPPGLVLPPPGIPRYGGKTDEKYVYHAKDEVRRAIELANLTAESRVLDIGCGPGRFLTGMLATFGRVRSYVGLDVNERVIRWAQDALTDPSRGEIRFDWLDVENTRYHPKGQPIGRRNVLPVDDASFDTVVLYSVFSHMTMNDTATYLSEIARTLDAVGRCYCTAFVEDDVPAWEENPPGYLREWSRPLHCARFNRGVFNGLVADAGLVIERFAYRSHPRQSAYVLRRAVRGD